MEMVHEKVTHSRFGPGTITDFSGVTLTVRFEHGPRSFLYPDAFEDFLRAENPEIQEAAMGALLEKRQEGVDRQKRREQTVETARQDALQAKRKTTRKKA